MTQTSKNNFKRTIRICYPARTGTLVIRTDLDWGRDVLPVTVSSDGNTAMFEIEAQQRFVHFKPCLIENGSLHWAVGPDNLLIMAGQDARPVYPYFFSDSRGPWSSGAGCEPLTLFSETPSIRGSSAVHAAS